MMEEAIAEKTTLLQHTKQRALALWASVVDAVTPPLCLNCQQPVTASAALCLECWQNLNFIDEPVCQILGTPFAYDEGENAVSPAAHVNPPHWDKARAAVAFDEASKHLVHALKYQDQQEAGLLMARLMTGAGRNILAAADVILPVPLHSGRLWKRRFNQAAFLAQQISKHSAKPWRHDVVLRVEATARQVGLSADERRRNVQGAFQVAVEKRHLIEGKTVVLVDDVRTTGATASACAETLKNAGALHVFVLSFALVLGPAQLHIEA
jgi:ComF family protein